MKILGIVPDPFLIPRFNGNRVSDEVGTYILDVYERGNIEM